MAAPTKGEVEISTYAPGTLHSPGSTDEKESDGELTITSHSSDVSPREERAFVSDRCPAKAI